MTGHASGAYSLRAWYSEIFPAPNAVHIIREILYRSRIESGEGRKAENGGELLRTAAQGIGDIPLCKTE
jgi:hypothetical protein